MPFSTIFFQLEHIKGTLDYEQIIRWKLECVIEASIV